MSHFFCGRTHFFHCGNDSVRVHSCQLSNWISLCLSLCFSPLCRRVRNNQKDWKQLPPWGAWPCRGEDCGPIRPQPPQPPPPHWLGPSSPLQLSGNQRFQLFIALSATATKWKVNIQIRHHFHLPLLSFFFLKLIIFFSRHLRWFAPPSARCSVGVTRVECCVNVVVIFNRMMIVSLTCCCLYLNRPLRFALSILFLVSRGVGRFLSTSSRGRGPVHVAHQRICKSITASTTFLCCGHH